MSLLPLVTPDVESDNDTIDRARERERERDRKERERKRAIREEKETSENIQLTKKLRGFTDTIYQPDKHHHW